eukprot:2084948-Rhodomonas_salina.2
MHGTAPKLAETESEDSSRGRKSSDSMFSPSTGSSASGAVGHGLAESGTPGRVVGSPSASVRVFPTRSKTLCNRFSGIQTSQSKSEFPARFLLDNAS